MVVSARIDAYAAFPAGGSGWLHEVSGNGHPRRIVIHRRKARTKPGLQTIWLFLF